MRPRTLLSLIILAASISQVEAQDRHLQALQQRLNNFSHENTICGMYYTMVSVCLGKDRPDDPTAKQYLESAQTFIHRSIETGRLAGVSDKAIVARNEMALDDMKAEVENNCSNISILLQKHARSCKALIEDAPARLEKMMR